VAIVALYLDSNAFISFLEGSPVDSDALRMLFEALRRHPGAGITSELTLAEVLAGSHKRGPQMKRAYLDLIVWSNFLLVTPVTREILYQSAELCIVHKDAHGKKLGLLDAIHLSTAIQNKCLYFISGDKGIFPPSNMTRVALEPAALRTICGALA
jgi:predicted nucleic acid-binding protein